MRVKILGCSGGIGDGLRTSAMLVDDDILIDAGTGVGDLGLGELQSIRHVFLTHSHLDHIAGLPLLVDAVFAVRRSEPLAVYARPETIEAMRAHIFNDVIWPDFTRLPSDDDAVMRFHPIAPEDRRKLGERTVLGVDVCHSVPALGFCVECDGKVFAFSGDTMTNKSLWPVLNRYRQLDVLVVEVSFPNSQEQLADVAGHYCPRTLAADIRQLKHDPEIWVTAMKPGEDENILRELGAALPRMSVQPLRAGHIFEL